MSRTDTEKALFEWCEHLETFLWDLSGSLLGVLEGDRRDEVVVARRQYRESMENL